MHFDQWYKKVSYARNFQHYIQLTRSWRIIFFFATIAVLSSKLWCRVLIDNKNKLITKSTFAKKRFIKRNRSVHKKQHRFFVLNLFCYDIMAMLTLRLHVWKLLRIRQWIHISLKLFRIAFTLNCSKLLRIMVKFWWKWYNLNT